MLSLPNVLLIGATGRNVGKTEYAVRLAQRFAALGPVAAVKITVIREGGGVCPRGGQGCGVCGSLGERPFLFQDEDCAGMDQGKKQGEKDTQRLRRAGANPVWWLRVWRAHLEKGLAALQEKLDPGVPVIAESNSARHGFCPGLFLMIRDESAAIKTSAASVMPYADVIVTRQADTWDIGIERPNFSDGTWHLRENAGAIILAGGASRRMGQDKAFLDWDGQPLIAHIAAQLRRVCSNLIISANDAARFAFLQAPVVPDAVQGEGPLQGLAAGLTASRFERNLVVACDMPRLSGAAARQLLALSDDVDVVVPRNTEGRPEPLFAIYMRSCLPALEKVIAGGGRRFTDLFNQVRVRWVDAASLPASSWQQNLNTPMEYQTAKGMPSC